MNRPTPRHTDVTQGSGSFPPASASTAQSSLLLLGATLLLGALALFDAGDAHAADEPRTADNGIEWKPERSPAGPMLVVVGIAEQRAQIYRNGVRIGSTPVSTGKKGHDTPTGLFSILEKKRKHRSNLYNDAPMPNMQRLTWDGVALHAGRIPGYPASHGCIRLPHDMSDKLFGVTSRGTLVAVVDSFPDTAVVDMTRVPIGADDDPNTDAILPSPAAGSYGPVSVVLSTHDGAIVVMRNGVRIGHTTVDIEPGSTPGERLYVGRGAGHWEELPLGDTPLAGTGTTFDTAHLRVDPGFGRQLEALLVPGTTVMITDQPLHGPTSHGLDDAMLASPIAAEFGSTIEAAP